MQRYDCLSRIVQSDMTPLEARDELVTLMFAAHDGIALALTYSSYLTALNPPVQADSTHAKLVVVVRC